MLSPIGPGIPEAQRGVLTSIRDAVAGLLTPAEPKPVFTVTLARLPPAIAYPHCIALVSDLNILSHSDGVHWIRQDTGAAIA
jgi:hypothetical protein